MLLFATATWVSLADAANLQPQTRALPDSLSKIGIPFVANAGQWDAHAAFGARTFAGTLLVTHDGGLHYGSPAGSISEQFVDRHGAVRPARPHGDGAAQPTVNFFRGANPDQHLRALATYEFVNLGDVFPGVNVRLRATGNNVEKIFTVAPRRDPTQIRVKVGGTSELVIGDAGELIARTPGGPVTFTPPIAFQRSSDGQHQAVEVSYAVDRDAQTYRFVLGEYDRARPLVIDPLLKSTFVGGSGGDAAYAMIVHPSSGEVYIAGFTDSSASNLTGAANGFDSTYNGGTGDAFVARLSADLTRLVAATYLGGSGHDIARALAAHPNTGDIYVTGYTASAGSFAAGVSAGAQTTYGGGSGDAFVARLSANLSTLHATTYLGGNGTEVGYGIAVHPKSGQVCAVGSTQQSGSNSFPVTAGALQGTYADGGQDAFVTCFSATLGARVSSTFLGGTGADTARAITIDPVSGDLFVVGSTGSSAFPGSASGAQPSLNGASDAFVARLNAGLTAVVRSTYLGAGASDTALAVAIHPLSRELIVSGESGAATSGAAFPGLSGAPQTTNAGSPDVTDAFISRLNLALTAVLRSTYLGSANGTESGAGLGINPTSGEIYIAGTTNSTPFLTPIVANEAYQTTLSANEMFVARYRADLSQRMQVTYLGTNNNEYAFALAIHPLDGTVLVAGYTGASNFPGSNGTPTAFSGGDDAVISALSPDLTAYNTVPNAFSFIDQSSVLNGEFTLASPNSKRVSNEVRMTISPLPPNPPNNVPAYVTGHPSSELCVSNIAGCCSNTSVACAGFSTGWISAPYRFASGDYIALRHDTPGEAATATTQLIIGGVTTTFRSSVGDAQSPCDLSTSTANGALLATREGLLLLRAMLGLTGTAVTAGTGVTTSWTSLRDHFNAHCGTNFQ
ncbi:MAG: hypothetical protein JNL19_06040 [Burkholderiales bacterium]|nr:hypothetical protein [Burkholderiales bacterium]